MSRPDPIEAIVDLANALGAAPINQHEGAWCCAVDGRWWVACNGHRERCRAIGDAMPGAEDLPLPELEPFQMHVYFNGWPAAVMHPADPSVSFAAGEAANVETFCAAVRARIALIKTEPQGPQP